MSRSGGSEPPCSWPSSGSLRLQSYQPASFLQPTTLSVMPREHLALIGSSGAAGTCLSQLASL